MKITFEQPVLGKHYVQYTPFCVYIYCLQKFCYYAHGMVLHDLTGGQYYFQCFAKCYLILRSAVGMTHSLRSDL